MNKPVASLSSSLLASKGRASAAGYEPSLETSIARLHAQLAAGRTAPQTTPLLKVPRPTAKQQPDASEKSCTAQNGGGDGGGSAGAATVRLSFRMDPAQHRRFALLAAHLGKSKQQILNEALSDYLERHGGRVADGTCACLGGVARRAAGNGQPEGEPLLPGLGQE